MSRKYQMYQREFYSVDHGEPRKMTGRRAYRVKKQWRVIAEDRERILLGMVKVLDFIINISKIFCLLYYAECYIGSEL